MTLTLRPLDKHVFDVRTVYEARDPSADDDSVAGRVVKQRWYNTVTGMLFMCTDATPTAAVWVWQGIRAPQYGPILWAAPTNRTAPSVTGSTSIGATLTCSRGVWRHTPTSYSYQWKRDTVAIVGETANTYVLAMADDTHSITCTVTAANVTGSASATSNAVVAGTWTPLDLGSALKGWWDAVHVLDENGLPPADGSPIKTMVVQSGNGNNHVWDTVLSSFPVYRASKTDTNFGPSKKALEFDGSQVITTPAPIALTQPFTVWAVVRSNVGDKVTMGGLGAWGVYTASGSGVIAYQAGGFQGGSIVTLGAWTIMVARFASVIVASKLRADGADATTADPSTGAGTGVGLADYAWGGNAMTGFIAEAGVALGSMSDADITKLEHYLSTTWGVDAL
jgi:hypothetical protein